MNFKKISISNDQLFAIVMLGFWVLLGLVELLRSGVLAMSGLRQFDLHRAFSFVSSYILSWTLLTYPILFLFKKTSNLKWTLKILTHVLFSVVFGFFQYFFNGIIFAFFMDPESSTWDYFISGPIQPVPFALNAALIYWVVMFLLLILDYYQKYKEAEMHTSRLETQLAESKLQALRMQLNPHFLFNALNTIAMLVRKKQDSKATQMISGLSDMLRTALTGSNESFIPLEEEISLLNKYLKLESIRFKETLKIELDIEKSILECKVPSLILQPIVENAFKHGISKHLDDSLIRISAKRDDNWVIIKIYNSGPELTPDWNTRNDSGVGLTNTIDRLETIYGTEYRFNISSKENSGVEVQLNLPIHLYNEP